MHEAIHLPRGSTKEQLTSFAPTKSKEADLHGKLITRVRSPLSGRRTISITESEAVTGREGWRAEPSMEPRTNHGNNHKFGGLGYNGLALSICL